MPPAGEGTFRFLLLPDKRKASGGTRPAGFNQSLSPKGQILKNYYKFNSTCHTRPPARNGKSRKKQLQGGPPDADPER